MAGTDAAVRQTVRLLEDVCLQGGSAAGLAAALEANGTLEVEGAINPVARYSTRCVCLSFCSTFLLMCLPDLIANPRLPAYGDRYTHSRHVASGTLHTCLPAQLRRPYLVTATSYVFCFFDAATGTSGVGVV